MTQVSNEVPYSWSLRSKCDVVAVGPFRTSYDDPVDQSIDVRVQTIRPAVSRTFCCAVQILLASRPTADRCSMDVSHLEIRHDTWTRRWWLVAIVLVTQAGDACKELWTKIVLPLHLDQPT